jgi:hypothetical protein
MLPVQVPAVLMVVLAAEVGVQLAEALALGLVVLVVKQSH